MARIKIDDIPVDERSSREEKKGIFGRFARWRGFKGKSIIRPDRPGHISRLERHYVINKIFPKIG